MNKRLSKTLAAEIAERTLKIVNPANRLPVVNEALRRHGFAPARAPDGGLPADKAALAAWLLAACATTD